MRQKIFLQITKGVFGCAGIMLVILSVFAIQIGIDNDPGWGKGRFILLISGLAFLLSFLFIRIPAIPKALANAFKQFSGSINRFLAQQPVFQAITKFGRKASNRFLAIPQIAKFQQTPALQRSVYGALGMLLVLLTYTGMINSKHTTFQSSTYYNQLADGFLAGQTSLLEKPPQALSDLENPYDWRNREGFNYLWDATFYQGEYYLYWGAVPALIASVIKLIHPMQIPDHWLVWSFCIGISILLGLLLATLHKQLFSTTPTWIILPFTWLGGASLPMLWLTTRPSVYEAAISGGQFFLMLGLFAALRALWGQTKTAIWLLLAGFAWGAAINCRITLAAAVAWFCLCLAVIFFRKQKPGQWFQMMLFLALPLLLWGALLMGYNALRFGSVFEMGHRYQLNGPGMPADYTQVISWQYILPSAYSYLIRPLQFESHFPYISAPFISESMWPFFIDLPKYYYYPEPTAGILFSTPLGWLAFLPLLNSIRRFKYWLQEQAGPPRLLHQQSIIQFQWISGGAALITFAILLVFNSASMRYLADIMPILLLLSASGFWWAALMFNQYPKRNRFLGFYAVLLIIISGLCSILANFSTHA